jgi:hypothetical protein
MSIIQIILISFAAFALSRVVLNWKRGALTLAGLAGWTAFWIAAAAVVIRPETASALARFLGVGRGADVVIYLALVAAFFLLFRLFAKIEAIERQLTKLVRMLALKDVNDERHDG